MNVSRLVSQVFQSQVSTFRTLQALSKYARTNSTSVDQVQVGHVSDKVIEPGLGVTLHVFLGKWVLDTQTPVQTRPELETLKGIQTYVSLARVKQTWSMELGFLEVGRNSIFDFKLGESSVMSFPDGSTVKLLAYQDGRRMRCVFQPVCLSLLEPRGNPVLITAEVMNNKLYWETEYPEHGKTTKIYTRLL